MKLIMYTGPECSLCDEAQALINALAQPTIELQKINIRNDAALYHSYGARIPVLKRLCDDSELGWPFDINALQAFLK